MSAAWNGPIKARYGGEVLGVRMSPGSCWWSMKIVKSVMSMMSLWLWKNQGCDNHTLQATHVLHWWWQDVCSIKWKFSITHKALHQSKALSSWIRYTSAHRAQASTSTVPGQAVHHGLKRMFFSPGAQSPTSRGIVTASGTWRVFQSRYRTTEE